MRLCLKTVKQSSVVATNLYMFVPITDSGLANVNTRENIVEDYLVVIVKRIIFPRIRDRYPRFNLLSL